MISKMFGGEKFVLLLHVQHKYAGRILEVLKKNRIEFESDSSLAEGFRVRKRDVKKVKNIITVDSQKKNYFKHITWNL